jgi:hypothetical protein
VATCSVRYIPTAWLWQVRDGGTITATLNGWMQGSGLVHLTLSEDGTAEGRFSDEMISYMPARPHGSPPRQPFHLRRGEQRPSRIDPAVVGGWMGRFVAQLAAPSAELLGGGDDVILLDVATGSQAYTRTADAGGWVVHQWGPLRLWDAVESAIIAWQRAGSPPQSMFGMTIDPDDYEQTVWLGSPDGPRWRLPG